MTLQTLYHELRTLPSASQQAASIRNVFERLCVLLLAPDLLPAQEPVHVLIALFSQMMKHHIISLSLKPGVPTVAFAIAFRLSQPSRTPVIVIPPNCLEQIRANPLHALGGMVFIASHARDFLCNRLERHHTLLRAYAFEAEFLRQMRSLHKREGLPWELNEYQQALFAQYPEGLASLSSDLVYPTPALTILIQIQEERNDE
ncbi:hypothetical protein KSF_087130 [Reticulibacter mediterranei]|uniref:Uncharacterized protein n=1 Tax=Reticulibacter mediterranei TaxID=2778369 RepID=A0A8J3N7N5_9CHLR|nr:hypothetical protein [Reticulibacter mediterranei]GHO98665.1 hypothetical protein KSF_087130 [Reticulibacter mediterranei]